jgi:hypothetical protein
MPVIPTFERLWQEESEFEASLGYTAQLLPQKKRKGKVGR